ncbi:aldehyde dehydrogenase family protein [Nocardioides zeae]|uniref:Aldehyde dehydrogenase domain-containing protein n=1 Tax=Nocardioides zeae TaxID=1457234 RepID=A0AAJ1TVU8_9ACTN|nr:aldehyde dehydrogenase family protein [Nocardioides zeae]MDQ1102995.1 hypothetical protein [Nocardioides zeae]
MIVVHATRPRQQVVDLPLLTTRGERSTHEVEVVTGPDGALLARLSLAPPLLVAQTLRQQERAVRPGPVRDPDRFARAAELFADDVLGGLSPAEHVHLVGEASGHGPAVTRRLTEAVVRQVAEAPARVDRGRPHGAVPDARAGSAAPERASGVWVRRGRTLGAVLSGNSPAAHNGWLQALALGYAVTVRPSRREPFTASRLVHALRAAGFGPDEVTYLPTSQAVAAEVLRRADLGLTYGGADVAAAYAGDPSVLVGGPGRSKTLVREGYRSPAVVTAVADAVADSSGSACVNTTGLLVEDPGTGATASFAAALRHELAQRHDTALAAGDHLGPRVTAETARAWAAGVERLGGPPRALEPHPDGGYVVAPVVLEVEPGSDALGTELPFPFVALAPWTEGEGVAPLRDSLVVTAYTAPDDPLLDALLDEPSVRNVHHAVPTTHSDGFVPHEDYLGRFLMSSKAFVTAGGQQ